MDVPLIAGVDEVGRGPLAGPVLAAAVILNPAKPIVGLKDSKALTELKREQLFPEIQEKAYAWAIARASVEEIDELNILQASLLAMKRAVLALNLNLSLVMVDGNKAPELPFVTQTIISGDTIEPAISAASIIAKVTRDREMLELHGKFPQYGFDQHKGYGTAQHLKAIQQNGICVHHRRSFAPCK